MELISYDDYKRPSQSWFLDKNIIEKIGIFKDIDDLIKKPMYLSNITDNIFSIIYSFCNNNNIDFTLYTMDILIKIFNSCDFLNFNDMQKLVAIEIAKRLNNMTYKELDDFVSKYYVI